MRNLLLLAATAGLLAQPGFAQSGSAVEYTRDRAAASAAFEAGQYATAMTRARAALSYSDWDGGLWLLLARAARRAGQNAEALTAYREALARGAPGLRSYDLELAIATMYSLAGSPDSAFALASAALAARAPRDRIARDSLLRALAADPRFSSLALATSARPADRVAGWRSDIALLVAEAQRAHASPAEQSRSTAFTQAASALAQRVPELTDAAVAIGIQQLLALLGDGHTVLYPIPTRVVQFGSVPIDLWRFPEGVFVISGEGEAAALVGARVRAVGGVPVDDLLTRLRPYVSRDNPMGYDYVGSYYLAVPLLLHAVGGTQQEASATYDLTLPNGQTRSVTLTAGGHPRHLPRLRGAGTEPPLWLRHIQQPFHVQRVPESRAVLAQVNQIGNGQSESLRDFALRVRDSLLAADATTLVLDLRHNNGGNNFLNPPLVELASWFEFARAGNRVYALTSRVTFSAAQNLVNALDRYTGTVFAGEPSGSKPNFTGEDNPLVLPWSGLTVSIANRYWADSYPEDARLWVAPDLPVRLSARDYFAGRDPLLEAVTEHARQASIP